MTSLCVRSGTRVIGPLVLLLAVAAIAHAQQVGVSESSMRRLADHQPMPSYPPASVRQRHTGAVVAFVVATVAGPVERVDILEFPRSGHRRGGEGRVDAMDVQAADGRRTRRTVRSAG
jgi:hypothetical protein